MRSRELRPPRARATCTPAAPHACARMRMRRASEDPDTLLQATSPPLWARWPWYPWRCNLRPHLRPTPFLRRGQLPRPSASPGSCPAGVHPSTAPWPLPLPPLLHGPRRSSMDLSERPSRRQGRGRRGRAAGDAWAWHVARCGSTSSAGAPVVAEGAAACVLQRRGLRCASAVHPSRAPAILRALKIHDGRAPVCAVPRLSAGAGAGQMGDVRHYQSKGAGCATQPRRCQLAVAPGPRRAPATLCGRGGVCLRRCRASLQCVAAPLRRRQQQPSRLPARRGDL